MIGQTWILTGQRMAFSTVMFRLVWRKMAIFCPASIHVLLKRKWAILLKILKIRHLTHLHTQFSHESDMLCKKIILTPQPSGSWPFSAQQEFCCCLWVFGCSWRVKSALWVETGQVLVRHPYQEQQGGHVFVGHPYYLFPQMPGDDCSAIQQQVCNRKEITVILAPSSGRFAAGWELQ